MRADSAIFRRNGIPKLAQASPMGKPESAQLSPVGLLGPHWLLAGLMLLLLQVAEHLYLQRITAAVWYPSAGLAIVLVAWFGRRGMLLVGLNSLIIAMLHEGVRGWDFLELASSFWCALLLPAEAGLALWCFRRLAHGDRRLGDPSSATSFLLVVPGACAGVFALLRVVPFHLELAPASLAALVAKEWLAHALGVLAIAPVFLVFVTPYLVRKRWLELDRTGNRLIPERSARVELGDWLEIVGLSLAMFCLVILLLVAPSLWDVPGWQLWGMPLLLIVWASLRRGLRGGVLLAAAVTVLTLVMTIVHGWSEHATTLLQCNLLAQCITALLVGASADWIRAGEARYRQVVGNIPVVIYSARILGEGRFLGGAPEAEVLFVSPACKHLLRCNPEELQGPFTTWLQRVHPNDQEILLAAVSQLGRHHQPVTCEYRLADVGPAGLDSTFEPQRSRLIGLAASRNRDRWVRDTLVPHFGDHGELLGWEGVLADITAQHMLADDLRRTTSMFHALVANLPAGVFFVQGDRPILVNTRARQLLGQRGDFNVGLEHLAELYRLHRPDGTPYPAAELPVALALRRGTASMRDDIVVHRPDGHQIPLVSWATPIDLGGQGRIDAAVWVLEDLTSLHKAETARRESEARLRAIIETMAEGLVVQDDKGLILEANPAACTILGTNSKVLRGRSLLEPSWQYLREDGSPFSPESHPTQISLETGQPVRDVILGLVLPSGTHWMLVSAMPLPPSTDRRGARVVTTFSDITAQRQAMDVVCASEEKYRGLVESVPLMVVQFDRDLRVTYANAATAAVSGYDREEISDPTSWQKLIRAEDLPRLIEAYTRTLSGESTRVEVRYIAKDGSEKVGYVMSHARRQGGAVVGGVSLILDLTRERELEQELQRAQRLELVGRLAGGIAHDFNNLLTVVLTLTDLARDSLPSDHPVRDDLRQIGVAGEQAANLASQLLTFSKRRLRSCRPVDVNSVTQRTLDLLRSTLPPNITVLPALNAQDLTVLADETQLQQVLMNLCLNARDAMPLGGRLEVETQCDQHCPVEGSGPEANGRGWVRLSVRDTGQGMAEQVKNRIFDPFFSTKERGTGLGLAVVRQIVESSGGRVQVWSEQGAGSCFDIWLPRHSGC